MRGLRRFRVRRLVVSALALALVTPLPMSTPADALSPVLITGTTTGTGLSPAIAFTTINDAPVITETAATTIHTGTYSFVPPTYFEFGGTAPTAAFTTAGGAGCALTVSAPMVSGGAITFTIGGSVLGTTTCRLTFAGIQARTTTTGPLPRTGVVAGGVITMSTSTASTITGITMGMTSFGSLNELSPSLMVTPATGGSAISANTAVGGSAPAWTALTGPTFTESAAGMLTGGLATGVLGFSPPTGFEFRASGVGAAASISGPGSCAVTASITTQTATLVIVSVSGGPSTAGNLCAVTVTGLAVRPTAPSPVRSGPIVEALASTGVAFPSSSFGILTEVTGPATTLTLNAPFGCRAGAAACTNPPSVLVQDAYGNVVSGSSVPVTLAFGTNTTGATISGVTNPTSVSGLLSWPSFSVDRPGSGYTLTATSLGLTTGTSTPFNVGYGICGTPVSNTNSCVQTFRVDPLGNGTWTDLRTSTTTTLDVVSYFPGQLQVTVNKSGSSMPQDILIGGTYSTSSVFDIAVNLGTYDPIVTAFTGDVVGNSVTYTTGAGGNVLAYQGRPRAASWSNSCTIVSCGGPTTIANNDITGQVLAGFADMSAPPGLTAAQLANFNLFKANAHGSWISTNAQAFSFPHDDHNGGFTFDMAAPHFMTNGTTVNTGFFTAFIPDSLIINYWGIADPATLTSSALTLTRRDGATTTILTATVTRVAGGLLVSLPSFSYSSPTFAIAPLPAATSISVTSSDVSGGPVALITGRALRGAAVTFGGTPSPSVTYTSSTQITAVVPPHAAGAVPVVVTTSGGSVTVPGVFTYVGGGVEADPPPVTVLPAPAGPGVPGSMPGAPPAPVVSDLPVQLGSGGSVTAPLTIRNGGATVDLNVGTTVRTTDGAPFTGLLQPPAPRSDPTGGKLTNVYDFTTSAGSVEFDRPVTLTVPAPEGGDPNDYQPVFVDAAGKLTYLVGRTNGFGVSFDTTHLSLYGLARIARPAVVTSPSSVVSQSGYHGRWAGQSEYADVAPGQIVELTARYLNTGDRGWLRGQSGRQAVLGTNAPPDNTRDYDAGVLFAPLYGRNRLATISDDVLPGRVGTFTFRVRAPTVGGTYKISVRALIEGSVWLEDEGVFLQLTVK